MLKIYKWLAIAAPLAMLAPAQMTVPDFKSTKPAPRTADGHPDLSGYWKGTRETKPGGNIAKDLPGLKLPLTPAGEAAWKHNTTATIDPESLCIIGGIPRHNASGLPFEVLQGANKLAFLYWYSYFRLIPLDAKRKHSEDPDPSFFGEEIGRWEKGETLLVVPYTNGCTLYYTFDYTFSLLYYTFHYPSLGTLYHTMSTLW